MNPLVLAAEEGAEHAVELAAGGAATQWAGLMLVSPFVAFLLIIWLGKNMKYKGGEFAVAAMGLNLVIATILFFQNAQGGILNDTHIFEIGRIGLFEGRDLVFELGWMVDGLSIMMYWVVAFVGLLVFIYALGYMHGDVRVTMFFASFSLFAGAMLILVGAPNLIQLIIGWEGVGLASYLLIGHYWEDLDNVRSGNKAFLTNKVADVGLILGAIFLGMGIGDFRFTHINEAAAAGEAGLQTVAVAGALLMFLGAMGKSAQFPLHIWLPDAMAGPTPVSALMHAATMVTAGVYLMARLFPVYQYMAGEAEILGGIITVRGLMVGIGAITLLAMGLLALVANDLKKVLAYSTVSQLGYMMTAVAAGGYTAGLFHLFTHAFFKALLFLGAGSVIHAVHSNNMTDMGGLRKDMPHTFRTFIIGSLALAGIIPLAGFWSKDEILATLDYEGYTFVFWVAVAGAFVTAFYMTRAIALTFFGTYKGHGHPHESPTIMTGPLWVLAVPSVIAGFLNVPGLEFGSFHNFTTWLAARVVPLGDHHPEAPDWGLAAIGLGAAVLGIALGWLVFGRDADTQEARDRLEIPVLYPLLRAKYFMDHIAWAIVGFTMGPAARAMNWVNTYILDGIVNGVGAITMALGRFVYGGVDQRGIDGFFNGVAMASDAAGSAMRKLQTGRVQQYAAGFMVGALVLVAAVAIFR
ncbi:MAG: NADH-quinone oxidoreductase subunit L [Acidimicrobiia bacterium]|nr:NADH-quinone oxidoreductase subunit L [Acidimicrobiia bacterium]MDH4307171.1 NADH-quinone oxidoreductase subunit L [Acidimicrobiia bacterium]